MPYPIEVHCKTRPLQFILTCTYSWLSWLVLLPILSECCVAFSYLLGDKVIRLSSWSRTNRCITKMLWFKIWIGNKRKYWWSPSILPWSFIIVTVWRSWWNSLINARCTISILSSTTTMSSLLFTDSLNSPSNLKYLYIFC